ncbi:endonuclease [Streptomyces kaniharaensis]|uniref:Endonuclease n=1 Tax=Streptomyces kaniharaensis TaxID=212423 RepID=A0A6N7KMI7_9ACTN|nr:endonuclease [Streptomyces kaniharaensis]MQS10833.1 endonuclease [Streptomyces kaniharaensis]
MNEKTIVPALLDRYGTTYAEEAGITLRDTPAPLYRLLVLTVLCSIRISAATATAAARELFGAGLGTPQRMTGAQRRVLIAAFARAHYVRYDESTATALGRGAELLLDRWHGDLRRLRDAAGGQSERIGELLQEFPRVGPVGSGIFRREAQAVWPSLRPFFDERTLAQARLLGLPGSPAGLAGLVPPEGLARLAAALTRASLEHVGADELEDAVELRPTG